MNTLSHMCLKLGWWYGKFFKLGDYFSSELINESFFLPKMLEKQASLKFWTLGKACFKIITYYFKECWWLTAEFKSIVKSNNYISFYLGNPHKIFSILKSSKVTTGPRIDVSHFFNVHETKYSRIKKVKFVEYNL